MQPLLLGGVQILGFSATLRHTLRFGGSNAPLNSEAFLVIRMSDHGPWRPAWDRPGAERLEEGEGRRETGLSTRTTTTADATARSAAARAENAQARAGTAAGLRTIQRLRSVQTACWNQD